MGGNSVLDAVHQGNISRPGFIVTPGHDEARLFNAVVP
jgi:hypothetical protein